MMNCESTRNRMLALADPAVLPEPLLAHINICAACRSWHQLLIQVESAVEAIAVPASDGKAKRQLIAQFQSAPAARAKAKAVKKVAAPNAPISPAAARQPLGERLARLWPVGLVAAAVLVGAIAWSIFGGKSNDQSVMASLPPDPMLKEVVAAKVKLDTAPNTAARVEVLASLGQKIHDEAGALSKVTPGAEMTSLAKLYEQVVLDALVYQARSLSEDERRKALPAYAEQLAKAEQNANRLAAEAPVGSDQPLRDIAAAAAAAKVELTKLSQGRAL